MDTQNVSKALALCEKACFKFEMMSTSFFLGRHKLVAGPNSGLPGWQDKLFIAMSSASGLGISLLPSDAVLSEHRQLGPADGFDDQPASEIALVKGRASLTNEAKSLGGFLADSLG